MRWLPLPEWDATQHSKPHHPSTLRTWAKTGQIYPPAKLVGREWLVLENAVYVGLAANDECVAVSDRVRVILG